MTNTAFTADLLEQLNESNVLFGTILHLPTLALNSDSKGYSKFLGEVFKNNNGVSLVNQLPEFDPVLQSICNDPNGDWSFEYAQEIAEVRGDFEFLVGLEVFSYYGFAFTDEGKFQSCSVGQNCSDVWIFAKDMQHAAVQAIEINDRFFESAKQRALFEQGFSNAE